MIVAGFVRIRMRAVAAYRILRNPATEEQLAQAKAGLT